MALTPNKILFYLLVLFKIRPTPVPSSKHYILMTTNVGKINTKRTTHKHIVKLLKDKENILKAIREK